MSEHINPADCKPDEVYTGTVDGERLTLIRARPDQICQWVSYEEDAGFSFRPDFEVSDLVPLGEMRPMTRADLPDEGELADMLRAIFAGYITESKRALLPGSKLRRFADAVVEHVNSSGGIPAERRYGSVIVGGVPAEHELTRALRERDEWKRQFYAGQSDYHATIDELTRERDEARRERDEWKQEHDRRVVHGSVRGDTYAAMVRERDEWKSRAEKSEQERDGWKAVAELRSKLLSTPAVTREDVTKAVRGGLNVWGVTDKGVSEIAGAVCALVSGDDPAVVVVRESEVAAVGIRRRRANTMHGGAGSWELPDERWMYSKSMSVDELHDEVKVNREGVTQALAVARAIEAERATDQVEELAEELWEAGRDDDEVTWDEMLHYTGWGLSEETTDRMNRMLDRFRRMARAGITPLERNEKENQA